MLYEYNNTERLDLGNGRYRFSMVMARPFQIWQDGNKIYNISGEDTISYNIWGAEKYAGKGKDGVWEDIFEINSDSIVYEYNSTFDSASLKGDTVLFFKGNRIALKQLDIKILEDDSVLSVKETKKVNKYIPYADRIVYKYDRKDKTKPVKVDPTWSWQPDATQGKDTKVSEADINTNYGTDTELDAGGTYANVRRIFIQFISWQDSINGTVDSAFIYLKRQSNAGDSSVFICPVSNYWAENLITWNNKPSHDSINYVSNILHLADSLADGFLKFDITNAYKAIQSISINDSGFCARLKIEGTGGSTYFYSSDYATVGSRPYNEIYYTEALLHGIIPKVARGIIQKIVDKGVITPKVRAP